jgi:hypothetical protein
MHVGDKHTNFHTHSCTYEPEMFRTLYGGGGARMEATHTSQSIIKEHGQGIKFGSFDNTIFSKIL